jgi:hypothetical protein
MSNYLAIATVTETLRQLLDGTVGVDLSGAKVTLGRPNGVGTGGSSAEPTINLYLYQVTPNAALRNADLPTRGADGSLRQRPRVALDLHYLVSFYGDEGECVPQRLLGSAVRTFHAKSVLTRQMIQDALAHTSFTFLAASNLAEEVELVKFTPLSLSLEELSKLWSVFFQTPYALSVAYQGTVVLIESDDTPQAALPVRERNVYAIPFKFPAIEAIASQDGEDRPIVASSTLVVTGKQLQGDVTLILLGGIERTPLTVSNTQLAVPVSSDLRAGVQGLQVLHQIMIGTPAAPHRGVQSNVAAFVLRPEITSVSASSTQVTVVVTPTIGMDQRVTVLLNERTSTDPAAYTFNAPARPADAHSIDIPISGVRAAEYFVRIQVDGAESILDVDTTSPTFGPTVTIP